MEEDKKVAVNIGVSLSGQLITAALAMIAVIGAFATFSLDKREIGPSYYIIIGIAFLSFVISIFCGGKGIDKARVNGHQGIWEIKDTKDYFNWQGICCFLGIFFLAISIFIGKDKKDETTTKINNLSEEYKSLKSTDSLMQIEIQKLKENNLILKSKIDSLIPRYDTVKRH